MMIGVGYSNKHSSWLRFIFCCSNLKIFFLRYSVARYVVHFLLPFYWNWSTHQKNKTKAQKIGPNDNQCPSMRRRCQCWRRRQRQIDFFPVWIAVQKMYGSWWSVMKKIPRATDYGICRFLSPLAVVVVKNEKIKILHLPFFLSISISLSTAFTTIRHCIVWNVRRQTIHVCHHSPTCDPISWKIIHSLNL